MGTKKTVSTAVEMMMTGKDHLSFVKIGLNQMLYNRTFLTA